MKTNWRGVFETALRTAARGAQHDLAGLAWETCTTDATWGDRVGLVFWGASPETCERAARYFEAWASRHMREYETQESIRFEGLRYYTAFDNGARGWHREPGEHPAGRPIPCTSVRCTETRVGFATSYAYYPCAD